MLEGILDPLMTPDQVQEFNIMEGLVEHVDNIIDGFTRTRQRLLQPVEHCDKVALERPEDVDIKDVLGHAGMEEGEPR
jgi:hypothetical protein